MQLREVVSFTKGRIIVRGKIVKRGKAKRADYETPHQDSGCCIGVNVKCVTPFEMLRTERARFILGR